jgi:cell division protein FtsL
VKHAEDTELLLERARRAADRPRDQAPAPAAGPRTYPGYAMRTNRKAVRRKRSTFTVIAALAAAAAAGVLYISNILAVNRLADEVNALRVEVDRRVNGNRILQADIDRKSTWERMSAVAVAKLGLQHATEPPATLVVPEQRVRDAAP